MLKTLKKLKEIEKLFITDKNGKFKNLKFNIGTEKVDLSGKSINELTAIEAVKLKKYASSFINEAMSDLMNM